MVQEIIAVNRMVIITKILDHPIVFWEGLAGLADILQILLKKSNCYNLFQSITEEQRNQK
ncbi:hypothetical protein CRP01_34035 [Flavilitoribacter nigricans DSM 23189 = NBRC 102662]|uniref:Uncharacterized protein n=1 Tax=Flavilitoribacter nigricans (strain ATCC 23147 / DSM 23189 / NBRC 102662 / NCIMB 1420 / SS-2) TaxID=1122177 RepID=A0A2D0N111_FLAN2|nr:hypothetical protein CRP01_34035 [Flavilitoribacter nigricans DSM 23189 = NBRC 102662]